MEPRGRIGNYPMTLADSGRSYPRSQVRHGFCAALERHHLDRYPKPPPDRDKRTHGGRKGTHSDLQSYMDGDMMKASASWPVPLAPLQPYVCPCEGLATLAGNPISHRLLTHSNSAS
jgi:hypothetical protein